MKLNIPHFWKNWEENVVIGIAMALSTLLIVLLILRVTASPDPAKWLPQSTRILFWSDDARLPTPWQHAWGAEIPKGRRQGYAEIENRPVWFFELSDAAALQRFLDSKKTPNSKLEHHDQVTCLSEAGPACWVVEGKMLWLATEFDPLLKLRGLKNAEPVLKSSPDYVNHLNRLPRGKQAFFYANLRALSWQGNLLQPLIANLYPSLGFTLQTDQNPWQIQAFLPRQKSLLKNPASIRSQMAYKGKLLAFVPEGLAFEWGGTEIKKILSQMSNDLLEFSPGAAELWNQSFGNWLAELDPVYFHAAPEAQGEFFIGQDQQGHSLFLFQSPKGKPWGELQKPLAPWLMEQVGDIRIIANDEALLKESVARANGQSAKRDLDTIKNLVPGTDEFMRLDMDFLKNIPILRGLASKLSNVSITLKRFDDGLLIRSTLQLP